MVGLVFWGGVIIASGAQALARLEAWGPRIVAALLAVALVDSWAVGPPNLRYMYRPPQRSPEPVSREFRQVWSTALDAMGMATLTLGTQSYSNCERSCVL